MNASTAAAVAASNGNSDSKVITSTGERTKQN